MDAAGLHTVVLYVVVAVALGIAVRTRRGPKDPPPSGRGILKLIWPFAIMGLVEMLKLRNSTLIEEWLFPGLAALFLAWISRIPKLVKFMGRLLVAAAFVLWLHGDCLLHYGYLCHSSVTGPGWRAQPQWYTPLTGFRPRVKKR